MSDVGIDIGPFALLLFALVSASPGILFGAASGAVLWRSRRVTGALLGAVLGWLVGIGVFAVWRNSTLSGHIDYWDACIWLAQTWCLPGWCVGAAIGLASSHGRRFQRIVGGGVIGALAGVAAWAGYALLG